MEAIKIYELNPAIEVWWVAMNHYYKYRHWLKENRKSLLQKKSGGE